MSTTSSNNTYVTLRNRLLNFTQQGTGLKLQSIIGTRLYYIQIPDNNDTWPCASYRFINRITSGAYNGDRETADLEVMIFGRPRSQQQTVEDAADICDEAMLRYIDSTSGLIFSRSRQRDSLPPFDDPADREIVAVRLAYPCVIWPRYLTKYAVS
jgi:hypothetical protein